jgi:glycosyltransferase involved in cell wall biosynthesis
MSVRISVITAVYNRASTLASAIESVLNQSYGNIEYIVVDGNSTDGTDKVVEQYEGKVAKYIREGDFGIYDALNKGIAAASGDVVGVLHADDLLANRDVLSSIAAKFEDDSMEAVYGDLIYVSSENTSNIARYWQSGVYSRNSFRWGWMPPHPTVYLRRKNFIDYGGYRVDFQISSDYELLIRMLYAQRLQTAYIDRVLVKMRLGGKSNSSMWNRLLANHEDRLAWEVNGLKAPVGLRLLKPLRKLCQFWERPPFASQLT